VINSLVSVYVICMCQSYTQVKLLCLQQEKEGLEIALQKAGGTGSETDKSKLQKVRNLSTIKISFCVLKHIAASAVNSVVFHIGYFTAVAG